MSTESPRFHVVLSYSTHAEDPREALRLATAADTVDNGLYVEVFEEGKDEAIVEGDIKEVLANMPAAMKTP